MSRGIEPTIVDAAASVDESRWSRFVLGATVTSHRQLLRVGLAVIGWLGLALGLSVDLGAGFGLVVSGYVVVVVASRIGSWEIG